MISASSLERIRACPMSARLPQIETPSSDSSRGTAVHAYIANVISGRKPLAGVPAEFHELCEAIDLSTLPAVGSYSAEVAFAFDVIKLKARTSQAIGRKYDAGAYEIPGTADAVGVTNTHVVVIDWKSAWSGATKAAENPQVLFYALCASQVFGRPDAIVAIARVDDDRIRWDVAEVSAMELDLFGLELRKILVASQESNRYGEGEHCRYCPAFDVCPAKQALMRAALEGTELEAHVGVAIETMDDAARAEVWRRIKGAEDVIERVKAKMIESIKRQPIRMGDRAIAAVEETRRSVDVAAVLKMRPELQIAVKQSISISDCEKLLGKRGMQGIESAIKVSRFTKIKEIDARRIEQND